MQQTHQLRYQRCLNALVAVAWIFGLLLAGSDSPYMPWANIIGLIIFTGAGFGLCKRLRLYGQVKDQRVRIVSKKNTTSYSVQACKKNHRIKVRFA